MWGLSARTLQASSAAVGPGRGGAPRADLLGVGGQRVVLLVNSSSRLREAVERAHQDLAAELGEAGGEIESK